MKLPSRACTGTRLGFQEAMQWDAMGLSGVMEEFGEIYD